MRRSPRRAANISEMKYAAKKMVNMAGRARQYVAPNAAGAIDSASACISPRPSLRSKRYTSAHAATPSAMNARKRPRYPNTLSVAYISACESHSWSTQPLPAAVKVNGSARGIDRLRTMYSPVRRCHQ